MCSVYLSTNVGLYLGSTSNLTTADVSSRGNLISVTPVAKRKSTSSVDAEHSNPCTGIGNTLQVPVIVTSYDDQDFKPYIDSEDSL